MEWSVAEIGSPAQNEKGAVSFRDSPSVGGGATVLLVAAVFAHQCHHEDNWQSNQSKHEEKSKAHHREHLLSCFI